MRSANQFFLQYMSFRWKKIYQMVKSGCPLRGGVNDVSSLDLSLLSNLPAVSECYFCDNEKKCGAIFKISFSSLR